MSQPVTLYSPDGKHTREIAAIDVPGWVKAGWSTIPVIPPAAPQAAEVQEVLPTVEPTPKTAKRNDVSRNAVPES